MCPKKHKFLCEIILYSDKKKEVKRCLFATITALIDAPGISAEIPSMACVKKRAFKCAKFLTLV